MWSYLTWDGYYSTMPVITANPLSSRIAQCVEGKWPRGSELGTDYLTSVLAHYYANSPILLGKPITPSYDVDLKSGCKE